MNDDDDDSDQDETEAAMLLEETVKSVKHAAEIKIQEVFI